MIVEDKNGNQLLALQRGAEASLAVAEPLSSRIEYGGLYAIDVVEVHPFEPNTEIEATTWWDRLAPIGDVGAIDAKLIELAWQTP